MTDLVRRLRDAAHLLGNPIPPDVDDAPAMLREAADAIERLTADLKYARESWGLVDAEVPRTDGPSRHR